MLSKLCCHPKHPTIPNSKIKLCSINLNRIVKYMCYKYDPADKILFQVQAKAE